MPTDTIKWIEINWKVLDTINDNRSIIGSTEVVQEGKWGTISPDEEKTIAMQVELTALMGQFTLAPNLKKAAGKKPGDKKNDGDKPTPPKGKKKNKKNTAK